MYYIKKKYEPLGGGVNAPFATSFKYALAIPIQIYLIFFYKIIKNKVEIKIKNY
jgi:hypothetical protein